MVGISDPDPRALRSFVGPTGVQKSENAAKLIETTRPDVVHICTPLNTHRSLTEFALGAGANAVVEKPLAPSASETEALLILAEEHGLVVCPAHQLVFQRWLPHVAATGEIVEMNFSACSAGAMSRSGPEMDRIVDEILPHPLSLFERLLTNSLAEAEWNTQRPAMGELRSQAAVKGVSLGISISMKGRPTRLELRVTGTRGTLQADLFHGFATFERAHASRAYKIARPFATSARQLGRATSNLGRRVLARESAFPGLRDLVRVVYAEIRGEGPPALPAEHVRQVALAREVIASVA